MYLQSIFQNNYIFLYSFCTLYSLQHAITSVSTVCDYTVPQARNHWLACTANISQVLKDPLSFKSYTFVVSPVGSVLTKFVVCRLSRFSQLVLRTKMFITTLIRFPLNILRSTVGSNYWFFIVHVIKQIKTIS